MTNPCRLPFQPRFVSALLEKALGFDRLGDIYDRRPRGLNPIDFLQYTLDAIGVTDHSIFHSIYFFDPNGHRLELAYPDENEAPKLKMLDDVKWAMLDEWSKTKRAPKHAAWMHEKEFDINQAKSSHDSNHDGELDQ